LSTTNPTWPDPGANPGRRGGKPATNRLSYGAAYEFNLLPLWDRKLVAQKRAFTLREYKYTIISKTESRID
jgi:hypothetical protein